MVIDRQSHRNVCTHKHVTCTQYVQYTVMCIYHLFTRARTRALHPISDRGRTIRGQWVIIDTHSKHTTKYYKFAAKLHQYLHTNFGSVLAKIAKSDMI